MIVYFLQRRRPPSSTRTETHMPFTTRVRSEAYFGDANSRQDLGGAGTSHAEIFVIAVDNPDRAVEIARMVRMHFPGIRVYARATDRLHTYRLMEVGVNAVHREMFASSITLARDVFVGLGLPAPEAEQKNGRASCRERVGQSA